MTDKKYYTDDQRRRYALDLLELTWSQIVCLKGLVNDALYQLTKYRYLSYDEIGEKYYQTSTIEDEGLTLVSYDEFLRINRLK